MNHEYICNTLLIQIGANDDASLADDFERARRIFTWLRPDEEEDDADDELGDDELDLDGGDDDGRRVMGEIGNKQHHSIMNGGVDEYMYDSSDAEKEAGLREYRLNVEYGEMYDEALKEDRRQYSRTVEANGHVPAPITSDVRKGRKGRRKGRKIDEGPELEGIVEVEDSIEARDGPKSKEKRTSAGTRPRLRAGDDRFIVAGFGLEESNRVSLTCKYALCLFILFVCHFIFTNSLDVNIYCAYLYNLLWSGCP